MYVSLAFFLCSLFLELYFTCSDCDYRHFEYFTTYVHLYDILLLSYDNLLSTLFIYYITFVVFELGLV